MQRKTTILITSIYFGIAFLFVGVMFACTGFICRSVSNAIAVVNGTWLAYFIFLLMGFFGWAYYGDRASLRSTFAFWTAGYVVVLVLVKWYVLHLCTLNEEFENNSMIFIVLHLMPFLSGFYILNSFIAEKVFKKEFMLCARNDMPRHLGRCVVSLLYFLASLAAGVLLGYAVVVCLK